MGVEITRNKDGSLRASGADVPKPHPESRWVTEQPRDEDQEGSERSAMEGNV